MTVIQASKAELDQVFRWLKIECEFDGQGFWSNRNIISDSQANGELWVFKEKKEAVGFQVGMYSTDICCVKLDYQKRGVGTALFRATLERAKEDEVTRLKGECSPPSSLPLWVKMGFKRIDGGHLLYDGIAVEMLIQKPLLLPIGDGVFDVDVILEALPETALYQEGVEPIVVAKSKAKRRANQNRVHLAKRFIIPDRGLGDPTICITVDGQNLCECKAKYDEAKAIGMKFDQHGGLFYLDHIDLS